MREPFSTALPGGEVLLARAALWYLQGARVRSPVGGPATQSRRMSPVGSSGNVVGGKQALPCVHQHTAGPEK